jgi:hypothetical protein
LYKCRERGESARILGRAEWVEPSRSDALIVEGGGSARIGQRLQGSPDIVSPVELPTTELDRPSGYLNCRVTVKYHSLGRDGARTRDSSLRDDSPSRE